MMGMENGEMTQGMMGEMAMGGAGSMGGGGGMAGMGGGGMDQGMMGMMRMMGMAPGATMAMPSALPGFPGASHLYHVGAAGFFLDHDDHIALSTAQRTALGKIKEKALLEKASSQRKIDEAEQQLWSLTASDQPDAAAIEGKVREIEHLRGEQRQNVIRAVGAAAKVLTDDQRQALLVGSAAAQQDAGDPHAAHQQQSLNR